MYMKKKVALLEGMLSAFTVLTFGFGTMYLLWRILGSPQGLPGLFSYRAATIGDGICLPILIGTSVAFNKYNELPQNHGNKASIVIVISASIIAAVLQASWLIRSDTALNWSIPIQHHFNLAGWYHSLFFITMFGIIAYQLCDIWHVMRKKQGDYSEFEKVLYMLFVFSGTMFLLMFASDDYGQNIPTVFLFVIGTVGVLMMLILFSKSASRELGGKLIAEILLGVVGAFCVSLFICVPVRGDIAIALGGGLCVCFLWRVDNISVKSLVCRDLMIFLFYSCALYVISGLDNVLEVGFVLVFLISITILYEVLYIGELRFRSLSLVAIGLYIVISRLPITIVFINDFIECVFVTIVYLLFKKEIKDYFKVLVQAEIKQNKNMLDNHQFKLIKGKVYFQIILGILATVILIARWLIDIATSRGNHIEKGMLYLSKWNIGVLLICCSILLILGTKQLRNKDIAKWSAVLLSIIALASLVILLVMNVRELPILTWNFVKYFMLICSFCACVGSAVLSAHGYYMNMVWLIGLCKKRLAFTLAIVQFVGGFLITINAVVLILCRPTWSSLFLIVVVSVITFVLIPLLHARVIQYDHKVFQVVKNNPLGSIAQDGMMICLIVLFAACMPCMYISLMKELNIFTSVSGLALVVAAFPPVGFCIQNNVEHIVRQKEVLTMYPEEKGMWDTLRNCLIRQSKQTVLALFPYVCVAAVLMIGKKFVQSKTPKEAVKEIMNTYIDSRWGNEENDMKK